MQLYYFISTDGRRLGPVPGEELVNCGITPDTLVWGQNMSGWAPANTVPEIVALFTSQPSPTQPQPSEQVAEVPEPTTSTDDSPIQTKNDMDSPSTSDPQTSTTPVAKSETPEPEPNGKKRGAMWGAIVIIIAILIPLCWVLFVKHSNSRPCAEAEVDYVMCVEELADTAVGSYIEVNDVIFIMIPVDGGTFTMGATSEQGSDNYDNERPTHQVTLSDYYIGETEVTQELWVAVMGTNPSYFTGNSRLPVERVSWDDCQEFIQELNRLTGKRFRLPTEAEWEFAARGGNRSNGYKYSGSNRIDDVAWYEGNSGYMTHEVATCTPNELGIYDMSGNVWEWCSDLYGSYSSSSQTNPTGPNSGSSLVYRGGSWYCNALLCRVSNRRNLAPGGRGNDLGFRLACSSL